LAGGVGGSTAWRFSAGGPADADNAAISSH